MEDILIPFFLFASIFGVVYVYLTSRNKERIALIEKGLDATIFNSGSYAFGHVVMSIALLGIGVGLGVLFGFLLNSMGMEESVAYTSCIFIFGGLGLLISFFVNRKMMQSDK